MSKRIFRGSYFDKLKGMYRAELTYKGTTYRSAYTHSEVEAQAWYDDKALELFGYDKNHIPSEIDTVFADHYENIVLSETLGADDKPKTGDN